MPRLFHVLDASENEREPSQVEARGPVLPPFNFNHPDIAKYPPEVTGRLLLKSMCRRLGWPSLSGKRLLDFGCGVRFAATLINLEIEIGRYFGIDVNAAAVEWLKANITAPSFAFAHLDMQQAFYNPSGQVCAEDAVRVLTGDGMFDAACMFSVITHQAPDEAKRIFRMLHPCAPRLYFTALIDDAVTGYAEKASDQPGLYSAYSTAFLTRLLAEVGWTTEAIYPPWHFHQTVFVCSRSQNEH
jgi:SAM-dependent methyltransferase